MDELRSSIVWINLVPPFSSSYSFKGKLLSSLLIDLGAIHLLSKASLIDLVEAQEGDEEKKARLEKQEKDWKLSMGKWKKWSETHLPKERKKDGLSVKDYITITDSNGDETYSWPGIEIKFPRDRGKTPVRFDDMNKEELKKLNDIINRAPLSSSSKNLALLRLFNKIRKRKKG